jgi:predicted nuclease of predicted toxin-antitoxin system
MNFLVDAQLPKSLTECFIKAGHDCKHTLQLPLGNLTSDSEIRRLSVQEKLILITKDTDFFHSYLLKKEPYKLIFVTVGNLKLAELVNHFEVHLPKFLKLLTPME